MKNPEVKQYSLVKTEPTTVRVEFFSAITDKPIEFINALERLCKKRCGPDGFFFKFSLED